MFFFSYTAAALSITCIAYAAVIFFRKKSNILARYLAYHIFAVGVWVGSNAIADAAFTHFQVLFWSGMALIGGSFFVSYYLCFVHAFIHGKRPGLFRLAVYFLPTTIFTIGAFSKFSVQETFILGNAPSQIIPGVLYTYVFFFFIGSLIYGSIAMAVHFVRRATPQQRMQVLYMETGFVILFMATMLFGVVLPYFGELRFFSVGPQFSIFLVALSSYAILKHQLLDIKLVIQKGLIYTILVTFVIFFYLGILYATLLGGETFTTFSYLTASLLTTFAGIFGIPPLKRVLEKITNPIFFRDRIPYGEAVYRLSQTLNRYLDMNELLENVKKDFRKILQVEEVHFLLLDDNAVCAKPKEGHKRAKDIESKVPDGLRSSLYACDQYKENLGSITESTILSEAEIIVPITLKDKVIALLALGKKLSEQPFFEEDVALLNTFSYQFAVAIEKAKLHEHVKAHSVELEKEVEKRMAELKGLREDRVQMMIDIAHNLQTPLTIVKGQLALMKAKSTDKKMLDIFERSIDKASEFIQRLLRLANLTREEKLNKEDVNLSRLLKDIIAYFKVLAEEKRISIKKEILDNLHVRGDKNQLEELILNLLSNAAKYIANEREVSIMLDEAGDNAMLVVRDTGVGISKEEIPELFMRFHRLPDNKGIKGSGLGLAICKRIAELHGGDISIESELGKWTEVTVLLPKNHKAL